MRKRFRRRSQRRGTAAVEFALVASLLFFVLMALIEFSRAAMVLHSLEGAANRGCRVAITELGTEDDVEEAVAAALAKTGIDDYTLEIAPDSYPDVGQWEPVTVSVSVDFDDVSWVSSFAPLNGITLQGSATLPRETGEISSDSDWIGDTKK